MKFIRSLSFAASILLVTGALAQAQSATWQIDPAHSQADFTVRHMGISNIHGRFGNIKGAVLLNDKDITQSSVKATIDTTTVDTGVAQRDTHLRSADFFDVTKYPEMTFVSTGITKSGDELKMTGNLTLHGVTKPVTLSVEGPSKDQLDPYGKIRRAFSATTTIRRQDFGLVWNGSLKSGDNVIGDDVKIELDIEVIKQ